MKRTDYSSQVFINCPLDKNYSGMFRACVFTVLDAGFIPRCSLEIDDATRFRLDAILGLIRECRYGIHDLSRVQLNSTSRLPRFNMPFELGLFYSAKYFGSFRQKQKLCLILEEEQYRYQEFISDIAGIDVTPHDSSIEQVIPAIRNWLVTTSRRRTIPQGTTIRNRFFTFHADIKKVCTKEGIDYRSMPFVELVHNMIDWLKINQLTRGPLFTTRNG